ncbi:MAG: substrate-binding domain-containing protein [Rhizobiales bacterium]|nr:substrate-binding domain-containing protein [Hyphomicrobiales bacterium]
MSLNLALLRWAFAAALTGIAAAPALAAEPYVIYLSNNFMGNDWRQQMVRSAEVSVKKGPLAGRVDLRIEQAEGTVQAQINSLNNIIRAKPNAILIDAASASALNPTIRRACDAGILVISFDQTVTEPCAFAIESDWNLIPRVLTEWTAEQIGGKGNVIVDRGLAGAPISIATTEATEEVFKKYPDIKIVGYFNSDYAPGPEQAGVAALLAANPQVDAVANMAYGTGAMQALKDAGRPMVPINAFSFNGTALACAQTEGASCILGSNPPYLSSEAIRLAVEILDTGKRPEERHIVVKTDFFSTHPFESKLFPGVVVRKIEIGKNAFPDLSPGLFIPVSPDWVEITPQEAAGK